MKSKWVLYLAALSLSTLHLFKGWTSGNQVSSKTVVVVEDDVFLRKTLAYGQSLQANLLNLRFNATLTLHRSGQLCCEFMLHFSNTVCPHPYIRVRLSGSALLSVKMVYDYDDHSLQGCGWLPVPGKYYFDANLIHCHVPYNTDNLVNNTEFRMMLKYPVFPDLSCSFLPYSFVIGKFSVLRSFSSKYLSAWVHIHTTPDQWFNSGVLLDSFISTKFQLEGWENNANGFFSEYVHKRFDAYKWSQVHFDTGYIDRPLVVHSEINKKIQNSSYSILFWGASHTRYLRNFFQDRYTNVSSDKDACEVDYRIDKVEGRFGFYFVDFADRLGKQLDMNIKMRRVRNIAKPYSHHVVSLGQHEASWVSGDNPSTPKNFLQNLNLLLDYLKLVTKESSKIYILTVNQNALGEIYLKGLDWRIPPVVDAYNREILSLAATRSKTDDTVLPMKDRNHSNAFIIDNSDIMDPIWDSATDFCHPCRYGTPAIASRIIDCLKNF